VYGDPLIACRAPARCIPDRNVDGFLIRYAAVSKVRHFERNEMKLRNLNV
jgi:hypothetical protein